MAWEKVATSDELARGPVVFRKSPRQIAVFGVGDRVFAVDNRCPHEGYPLAEGTVDDQCQLTCNWHNWKFRLEDGECVLGGDDVRRYAVRVDDGQVWVDVSDEPPDQAADRILKGLRRAYVERDFGRICRETTRLHFHGCDPREAVRRAIDWSFDRFEYGFTHAYAAAADWMAEAAAGRDFETTLVCLAEAVDHMSFDALRHPAYSFPGDGAWDEKPSTFLDAVEREDRETAERWMLAAVDAGSAWSDVEPVLSDAALAHFNDFGHSAIFVYKAGQLIDRLGDETLRPVLLALTRHLCFTTREDLIPEFQAYAANLARITSRASLGNAAISPPPLGVSTGKAMEWVVECWEDASPRVLYDALLARLAGNLVRFDASYDVSFERPVNDSVGWLHLTHGLTFANAVRNLCERRPALWPAGLLQMACFVGRHARFLDLDIEEASWEVEDAESLLQVGREKFLDHGLRDPIFSAHLIKTTYAIEEEWRAATSAELGVVLMAALNRFLGAPLKQKHVRRLARQAIALVGRDFSDA